MLALQNMASWLMDGWSEDILCNAKLLKNSYFVIGGFQKVWSKLIRTTYMKLQLSFSSVLILYFHGMMVPSSHENLFKTRGGERSSKTPAPQRAHIIDNRHDSD